jgi:hypothetical protein
LPNALGAIVRRLAFWIADPPETPALHRKTAGDALGRDIVTALEKAARGRRPDVEVLVAGLRVQTRDAREVGVAP